MGIKGWRRIAYAAFAMVALALVVVVSIRTGWWKDTQEGEAPGWVWLERGSWIAGIVGAFTGWLSWRLSAKAARTPASETGRTAADDVRPETPRTGETAPASDKPPSGRYGLLDRHDDRDKLRAMLRDERPGVVVVKGQAGIGKSRLVKAVLADLKRDAQDHLRIYEHEVVPGVRLDIEILTKDIERVTGPAADVRPGESSLARFHAAVEGLGDTRVVFVIERAENLVDRNSRHLVDYDLDEAFEFLTTHPCSVTVLLVTRLSPEALGRGTWPERARVISVRGLPYEEFVTYLSELDRNDALRLDKDPKALDCFYEKLRGNLRLAELLYAILAGDGVSVRSLRKRLSKLEPEEVPRRLTELIIKGLKERHFRVLRALAAYGVPVEADAVVEVLDGELSEEEVGGALNALHARHIIQRTFDGRYHLPPDEGWAPDDDESWNNLLLNASDALWRRRPSEPRDIDDLYMHFAALDALLRAGRPGSAYQRIEDIDEILRKWHCPVLLSDQREAVRGVLGYDHVEMANENMLGDLYARRGRWVEAAQAYDKALEYAEALNDSKSRMKIRANVAMMSWRRNHIEEARRAYARTLEEARDAGDLRIQLSALEGLAHCHRRWGRYDEAIAFAQEALAIPNLLEYPRSADAQEYASARTVKIALKLSRWHAELGEDADARRLLDIAQEEVAGHRDDWLKVTCLDGYADWLLGRNDLKGAIRTATAAVEKALRVHDPVVLLQARTTLCFAHLVKGEDSKAANAIEGAERYRQPGRSLFVLALHALVAVRRGWPDEAGRLFQRLHKEATERIRLDERDFSAWQFAALAICGRRMDDPAGLSEAVEAFRKAGSLPTRPTPGLTRRMGTLLRLLDTRGRLYPVIEAIDAGWPDSAGA